VTITDAYRETIESAHAARVARLRSASGWLSLVGKIFLDRATTNDIVLPDEQQTLVGKITFDDRVATFTPKNDTGEARVLRSDREGKADQLTINGFLLELMERGDTFALRVRDQRVLPRPYNGIDTYPIDPTWRVHARLEPHSDGSLRKVDLDFEGTTGSTQDSFVSPGTVVFEREGKEHRIQAVYEDSTQRRLFLLFRDTTSGPETYGLGRFVYADLPDSNGNLFVDFNLALLPGCAFTIFATCPIPPQENRLGIPVRAGEKNYLT